MLGVVLKGKGTTKLRFKVLAKMRRAALKLIQKCRELLPEHHWELIYMGIAKDVTDQRVALAKLIQSVLHWCDQVSRISIDNGEIGNILCSDVSHTNFKDSTSIGGVVTHPKTVKLLKHFNFEVFQEGPLPPELLSNESKQQNPDFKYWFLVRKPQKIQSQKKPQIDQLTDVTVGDLIGTGNYGQVFKGLWHATPVACKSPALFV